MLFAGVNIGPIIKQIIITHENQMALGPATNDVTQIELIFDGKVQWSRGRTFARRLGGLGWKPVDS